MENVENLQQGRKRNPFTAITLAAIIFVILLLISEVIITKQKYTIISLNKKIEQTQTLEEELKMDKAQLLSKSRLRSIAIDKVKMIPVENLDESIKNQILE